MVRMQCIAAAQHKTQKIEQIAVVLPNTIVISVSTEVAEVWDMPTYNGPAGPMSSEPMQLKTYLEFIFEKEL